MPHRVELVGEAMGVRWYDDSKATNPDATLRAVASFDSVVLLAGGRNKGLDLSPLGDAADHLRGVVAFGEAGPEIVDAIAGRAPVVTRRPTCTMPSPPRAKLAEPGDVVLLSPACASFDAYDGYAARGDAFAAEVRARTRRRSGAAMTCDLRPRTVRACSTQRESLRRVLGRAPAHAAAPAGVHRRVRDGRRC